ncbi:hypothetical protein L210DRAFT_3052461 [Boletus edulis BED1]|uniref:Uncharacterized protein n=1 Tax=Boletus edulis BED1 TaxID=1328754 RepID=A0AAD4GHZ8_BOLED|nr:hypothetical protein L210DRAFT_3052461 [Boletus edulis BED1]
MTLMLTRILYLRAVQEAWMMAPDDQLGNPVGAEPPTGTTSPPHTKKRAGIRMITEVIDVALTNLKLHDHIGTVPVGAIGARVTLRLSRRNWLQAGNAKSCIHLRLNSEDYLVVEDYVGSSYTKFYPLRDY